MNENEQAAVLFLCYRFIEKKIRCKFILWRLIELVTINAEKPRASSNFCFIENILQQQITMRFKVISWWLITLGSNALNQQPPTSSDIHCTSKWCLLPMKKKTFYSGGPTKSNYSNIFRVASLNDLLIGRTHFTSTWRITRKTELMKKTQDPAS